MVNPYNEHLLHAWRANMDVQVVGSVHIHKSKHVPGATPTMVYKHCIYNAPYTNN